MQRELFWDDDGVRRDGGGSIGRSGNHPAAPTPVSRGAAVNCVSDVTDFHPYLPDELTAADRKAYQAARQAGSIAAAAGWKVTENPHRRGGMLWQAWDRGWQVTFRPCEWDEQN